MNIFSKFHENFAYFLLSYLVDKHAAVEKN